MGLYPVEKVEHERKGTGKNFSSLEGWEVFVLAGY